ncbi:MAG: STAS domain-containing protein [Sporichthyaceae bacterium]
MEMGPASADDEGRVAVSGRIVTCVGEFDAGNSAALVDALREVAMTGSGFTVDLTGVTFVDSQIVAALFDAVPNEPVVLVRANSLIERVAGTVGLTEVVEVRSVPQ